MALDYPDKVKRLMVLDIAPTLFAFENMTHKSVSPLFAPSAQRKPSGMVHLTSSVSAPILLLIE